MHKKTLYLYILCPNQVHGNEELVLIQNKSIVHSIV